MTSEFLELRQGLMNVSQYDQRFTQLSRYADALVKSEAERIKRFMKGLKSEIRGRLIPLQLKNYLQAVERALEVEMDMQEGHEDWVKEFLNSKRPHIKDHQYRWHQDRPEVKDLGLMPLFKEEDEPEAEEHG